MSKRTEKVLLVEDDESALFTVSRVLELNGFAVQKVTKGFDALDIAKKRKI